MTSFFMQLTEATDEARRQIQERPAINKMLTDGLTTDQYAAFLQDLYHVVANFCPLMSLAISQMPYTHGDIRAHLYDSIADERGHETWVEADLRAIGFGIAPPSPVAQAWVGYNHHSVFKHPASIVGMLYALETIASVYGGSVVDSVQFATGLTGQEGFTFLNSHAELDADHVAQLNELANKITDPAAQEAIIESTKVNFWLFAQIVENLGMDV